MCIHIYIMYVFLCMSILFSVLQGINTLGHLPFWRLGFHDGSHPPEVAWIPVWFVLLAIGTRGVGDKDDAMFGRSL